ncbi:MAG: hypothetical protein LBQ75_07410, partial [Zoogloeaceae bacterium]|nr:hypothetical protein [Zoogloeaceae bacterium]
KNPLIQFAAWLCVFVAGMAGFSSAYAQKSHDVTRFDVAGVKLGMNYQNAKTAAAAYFGIGDTEIRGEKCFDKLSENACKATFPSLEAASKKCDDLPSPYERGCDAACEKARHFASNKCRHDAQEEATNIFGTRREYDPDDNYHIKASIHVSIPESQKEPVYPTQLWVHGDGVDRDYILVKLAKKDSREYRNGYAMHNNVMNVGLYDSKLTRDAVVKKYGSPSVDNSISFGVSLEWCSNPVKKKDGRYTCKTKPPQNIMWFTSVSGVTALGLTHKYSGMGAADEKAFKSGTPLEPK